MRPEIRLILSWAEQRARRKEIPFCLTEQDVAELWDRQNGLCYWFGVPMCWREDEGVRHPLLPTLDRSDNRRGYTVDNVVLCCWAANAAKGSADLMVWEEFCDLLRQFLPHHNPGSDLSSHTDQ